MKNISSATALLFFFNDTATTEIYTLSLHDALPIWFGSLQGDLFTIQTPELSETPFSSIQYDKGQKLDEIGRAHV